MLLGVDVGGTFTDAVLLRDDRILSAKAPTTPGDQAEGVLRAVELVLERANCPGTEVRSFCHGMTVATNALLEGKVARTALLATEGFTDIVELARQNRAHLYRLCAQRPAPLVPAELRFGVPERITPDGPLLELDPAAVSRVADEVAGADPETVAVVLLHSYRDPSHELALADALRRVMPEAHLSLSHEVVGTFREYERAATTEIDAALSPLLAGYLGRLRERARERELPEPQIMQSNGGLIDIDAAAGHAAWTVLSGPAAGAAGAAFVAGAAGVSDALCFDMGGTSCDVCVVRDGSVEEQSTTEIAGRPLALPTLAVHTVGSGGGSVAWRDPGGALRVGPRSAGADPGPACYGRGGTEATVTDANLLLGHLSADTPLAGGVALDRDQAERAIGRLAAELGLDGAACAEGIVRIAAAEMARAMRVVTVARGIDPRRLPLLAFGGAGPLHAARIADELGIGEILCPGAAGVLAALGLVVCARRRDAQRTVMLSGEELRSEAIAGVTQSLGAAARAALAVSDASLSATYELRYRGQSFELSTHAALEPSLEELRAAFEAQHQDRYGFVDRDQELELVTVRVTASTPPARASLAVAEERPHPARTRRLARIAGEEQELEVLLGAPPTGWTLDGPTAVELPESTVLIPRGWRAGVDPAGTLRMTRAQ